MDTPTPIVAPSPLPSVKALSSFAGGSSSSRKGGEIRLDVDLDMDTPTVSDRRHAPFVLIGNPEDVSQRSATISFWFPRRRARQRSNRDSTTAIQPGKPIDLFAWNKLGLLVNFVAVGFFEGMLPVLARVLFENGTYEASQLATVQQLVVLLRVVFALLSDVVLPASRHRRRVFLVLGWLLPLVLCAVLTGVSGNHATRPHDFFPLLMVLPLGHVLASVSADALMVEYAHREDLRERGCVQMLLLATRRVGELVGRSVTSTGNAPTTGLRCQGELDCLLELQYTFGVAAGVALVALFCSVFATYVPSRRRLALQGHAATTSATTKLQHAWTFLQHPTYLAFVVFGFLQTTSVAWATPSALQLATRYVGVSTATRWVSDGVSVSLQMVAALLMMALWRNTHWRKLTLALVAVSTLLTRLPADVVVLLNTSRSHVLFLGLHHVASLAENLMAAVRLVVAVEMAVPTMEATTFAVTTATFDLGTIAGSIVATRVAALHPDEMVSSSGAAAEWLIAACVAMYVVRVAVDVGSLHLLPIQKVHGQEQRASMGSKPSCASGIALSMLLVLLVAAVAFDVRALLNGTTGVPWTPNTWLSE